MRRRQIAAHGQACVRYRLEQTAGSAFTPPSAGTSCGLAFHQAGAPADRDGFAALVDTLMLELDDPGVLARLAAPLGFHDRSRPQRVAVEDRLRKPDIAHPQIGDCR